MTSSIRLLPHFSWPGVYHLDLDRFVLYVHSGVCDLSGPDYTVQPFRRWIPFNL